MGVPLRQCDNVHRPVPAGPSGRGGAGDIAGLETSGGSNPLPSAGALIQSPEPTTYVAQRHSVSLKLSAATPGAVFWFVDGEYTAHQQAPLWHSFLRGRHRVSCLVPDSGTSSVVDFVVR